MDYRMDLLKGEEGMSVEGGAEVVQKSDQEGSGRIPLSDCTNRWPPGKGNGNKIQKLGSKGQGKIRVMM